MTNDQSQDNFDPQAEFYDEEGRRYRNFAAWLVGDEDHCPLNDMLIGLAAARSSVFGDKNYRAWYSVHWQEAERRGKTQFEKIAAYASGCAYRDFANSGHKHPRDVGRATRAGVACARSSPLDAVHSADEPEIPGGLGA